MTGRPTFTVLLDWLEGRLDGARAAEVAAYVGAADEETRDRVEWIRDFLHDAQLMPLVQPPAELSERLRSAFVGFHSPRETDGWTDASMLYDTRTRPAAVGVRSFGDDGVHLAFDSRLGRFVLEVAPGGPGEVDLQGLIMVDGEDPGIDLAFLEHGSLRRAARAGSDGRFDVPGVPAGVDELWLTSGDTRVRASLDLRLR
ncbi:MAG TPA: hypothetical protein VD859_09675 [Nocardioides sp.]|nr:hypothetical protein [Nocardioides sp.]